MTPEELAWAAGLFEGEGCVHQRKGKTGGVLILRIPGSEIRVYEWRGRTLRYCQACNRERRSAA